ncbi:hypothetical protein M514_07298 [Trichuris suis]|uniref:Uncharacterized protein n=1 Tax=Trichuris suis TaxID=68888 RepID=A0A085M3H5_9BILA|nr:hypothetical protein M513_07298 [Trichuris suis]KFD64198.1 hypothetical protein M514_07298 [Trichuris suis]
MKLVAQCEFCDLRLVTSLAEVCGVLHTPAGDSSFPVGFAASTPACSFFFPSFSCGLAVGAPVASAVFGDPFDSLLSLIDPTLGVSVLDGILMVSVKDGGPG